MKVTDFEYAEARGARGWANYSLPVARRGVYQSPHRKGYQIMYTEDGTQYSVGYGPEAVDRTFTIEFPIRQFSN